MKIKIKIALIFVFTIALLQLEIFGTEDFVVKKIEITKENLYEIYEEAIESKTVEKDKNLNQVQTFFSNQISLKEFIKQECKKCVEEIDIASYKVTYEEVSNLLNSLFLDTELFHLYGYNIWMSGDIVVTVVPEYTMTLEEFNNYWTEIDKTTQEYLSKIDTNMTDLDKILFTNNYLCQICDYVEYETQEELNNIDWEYHTMAKALTEGYAVCDGYSKAFSYLLGQVGVEASLVTSDLLCHAWNLVKLDNDYYHIDTTWNDTGMYGKTTYAYFMLSDTEMFNRSHNVNNTKDWAQEYDATNTKFDSNNNAWINGIDNYLIYKDSYWYTVGLIPEDYMNFYLYKYDINENTNTKYTVNLKESLMHYPAVTTNGNNLYFSNSNKIMKMDFSGANVETLCTTDISMSEYIYAIEYKDEKFYYVSTEDLETVYEYVPQANITYVLNDAKDGYIATECVNCEEIVNLIIPEKYEGLPITEIGDNLCLSMQNLESVTLPNTITKIGNSAFAYARNLKTINLPNSLVEIGDKAFLETNSLKIEMIIPDSVTYLGEEVCVASGIKKLIVGNGVKILKSHAFDYCRNLEKVELKAVEEIEEAVFCGDIKLKEIILSDTLKKIGQIAFWDVGCYNLSYDENGKYVLDESAMLELVLPDSVTYLEYNAFGNSNFKKVVLSEGLEYLGEGAFINSNIEEIEIPKSITKLDDSMFMNTKRLQKVTFKGEITKIGAACFKGSNIKSIIIPESVTTIDATAFSDCENFTTIYGIKGSYAETFANENNFEFIEINNITIVETQEIKNEQGENITVMPIEKNSTIESFINTENFPGLANGTNEAVIKDVAGNVKSAADGIGSKNVIQIVDKATGNVIAEYTVVVRGDITGEGKARIFDAYEILKDSIWKSATDYPEIDIMIRDYDGDGKVRIFDAYSYLRDSIL